MARLDRRARVAFAPLQGKLAGDLGLGHHAAADGGSMVVLREADGMCFAGSDACIELGRALGGGWRLLAAVAGCVPRPLREAVYRWIARHRFRLFGRADRCVLAGGEFSGRLRE